MRGLLITYVSGTRHTLSTALRHNRKSDGERTMNFIQKLWKNQLLREIFRFLLVGGGATVVDFLAMSLVLYLMQPQIYPDFLSVFFGGTAQPSTLATVIGTGAGFLVGLAFNYVFSVLFVYKEKGNSKTVGGFLLFSVLSAGGLAIHLLGMYVGYDLLSINEWIVKIILTAVVLVYNYLTRKFLIFRKSAHGNSRAEAENRADADVCRSLCENANTEKEEDGEQPRQ